jgi:hypothetical protein
LVKRGINQITKISWKIAGLGDGVSGITEITKLDINALARHN